MTEILQKLVVNCETGEAEYIPLTAEEITQREADALTYAQQQAEAEAAAKTAADKKQAVLTALSKAAGLSVDEVTAVLS